PPSFWFGTPRSPTSPPSPSTIPAPPRANKRQPPRIPASGPRPPSLPTPSLLSWSPGPSKAAHLCPVRFRPRLSFRIPSSSPPHCRQEPLLSQEPLLYPVHSQPERSRR